MQDVQLQASKIDDIISNKLHPLYALHLVNGASSVGQTEQIIIILIPHVWKGEAEVLHVLLVVSEQVPYQQGKVDFRMLFLEQAMSTFTFWQWADTEKVTEWKPKPSSSAF